MVCGVVIAYLNKPKNTGRISCYVRVRYDLGCGTMKISKLNVLMKTRLESQYYHSIMDISGTNNTTPMTFPPMGVYTLNSRELRDHQMIQYQRMAT